MLAEGLLYIASCMLKNAKKEVFFFRQKTPEKSYLCKIQFQNKLHDNEIDFFKNHFIKHKPLFHKKNPNILQSTSFYSCIMYTEIYIGTGI